MKLRRVRSERLCSINAVSPAMLRHRIRNGFISRNFYFQAFLLTGACLLSLTLVFRTRLFAFSGSITVEVNGQMVSDDPVDQGIVKIGDQISLSLTATATPDPGGLTWNWSGPSGSASGSVAPSSTDSTSASLTLDTAGADVEFSVSATASGTDPTAGAVSGTGDYRMKATVVEVTGISLKTGVQVVQTYTLAKSDFDITTNPSGHEDLVDLDADISTPALDPVTLPNWGETLTVTAICGTSNASCTINVPNVTLDISGTNVSDDLSTIDYFASQTNTPGADYAIQWEEGQILASGSVSLNSSITGSFSVPWSDVPETEGEPMAVFGRGPQFLIASLPQTRTVEINRSVLSLPLVPAVKKGKIKDQITEFFLEKALELVKHSAKVSPPMPKPPLLPHSVSISLDGDDWENPAGGNADFAATANVTCQASGNWLRASLDPAFKEKIVNPSATIQVYDLSATSVKYITTSANHNIRLLADIGTKLSDNQMSAIGTNSVTATDSKATISPADSTVTATGEMILWNSMGLNGILDESKRIKQYTISWK